MDVNKPILKSLEDESAKEKLFQLAKDPIYFATSFFRHPKNSNKKWEPYDYQKEILTSCTVKKRVCINSSRQIGKSELVCIYAAWYAFTHENSFILISSKSQRQSSDLLRRIKDRIELSELRKEIVQSSRTSLTLRNRAMIVAAPESSTTIRGYSADVVLIDEAAHFPDDAIYYETIRPMLMHTKGQLIVTSTPNGRRGFFYDEHEKWSREMEKPNSDCIVYDLPCLVKGEPICPDFTMDKIEEEKASMPEIIFRQEYMGEFISVRNAFFPPEITRPCTKEYELRSVGDETKDYVMGIDWGQARDKTVFVIGRVTGPDERKVFKVYYIKSFVKVPYNEIIGEVKRVMEKFNIRRILADIGAGRAQIDELRAMDAPIDAFNFTSSSKNELYNDLRTAFEKKEIVIPEYRKLLNELDSFEYSITKTGKLQLRHQEGMFDDHVDAFALAWKAAETSKGVFHVVVH